MSRRQHTQTSKVTVKHPNPDTEKVGPRLTLAPAPDMQETDPRDELDGFFVRGQLVKPGALLAPLVVPVSAALSYDTLRAELELARTLQRRSLAQNTRLNYGWHTKQWITWCQERGISPLTEDHVWLSVHLALYSTLVDDSGSPVTDSDGNLVGDHSTSSVAQRMAGINKFYEYAGKPRPGDDRDVMETMRGIRRQFFVRPQHAKAALDSDKMVRLICATEESRLRAVRDCLLLLLRAAGLSSGQISRLSWPDVSIDETTVTITAGATCRYGSEQKLTLPQQLDPQLNAATLFAQWQSASMTLNWVFPGKSRKTARPLTREAINLTLNGLAARHGGYAAIPELGDDELARIAEEIDLTRSGKSLRDQALLLTGWVCALRRSNIVDLDWCDLNREQDGWSVLIRRSKTDQEGRGETKILPMKGVGSVLSLPCSARAMDEWRSWLTNELGQDPKTMQGRVPVFPRFGPGGLIRDQTGNVERLSGASVNELIQDLGIAAGLATKPRKGERNPYGAHSLRAGFVTEMSDKMPLADIQRVTGHKSLDVLSRYIRKIEDTKNSPVAQFVRGSGL